ncbi:Alpha/Beta hydrolase protein [Melampsora americana]|nr:Alpha/Beta hydrolase protein [Melampsora americana]
MVSEIRKDHHHEPIQISYPDPPPSTPFSHLIPNQTIAVVSEFQLISGIILKDVPVAYQTWGKLNQAKSNCMIICHALTGSADVEDWWGPLMGPGLLFDPTRYFIFCANVLGSPYGTASPVTINPNTGLRWGPEFPSTSPRDDVQLQKLILDHLGVESIAVVIGGSMGGMQCLEWPLMTPKGYVRNIVPIATCARHSAWGISWGEAQRQSIYSDPKYQDGYYDQKDGPITGLAAARMAALLTYRSRDSFETRFGRRQINPTQTLSNEESDDQLKLATLKAVAAHNDGHRLQSQTKLSKTNHSNPKVSNPSSCTFSAQSYLRYQGNKFVNRFDANCYIHLTRKMDTHDVDFGRENLIEHTGGLEQMPEGTLVVAIDSDGLFMLSEQREMVECMPKARLVVVESKDGHDGFLLEFEQINRHVLSHLHERLKEIYEEKVNEVDQLNQSMIKKESLFGEIEEPITDW